MSFCGNRRGKGDSFRNEEITVQVRDNDRIRDDSEGKKMRKKILQNLEPNGKFLQTWNVIFIVSCVIAISLDPLFFYLPVINEARKCLVLDTKLKIIAICLRSVTDFIFLSNIILQLLCPYIYEYKDAWKLGKIKVVTDAWSIAKRYLLSYFLIDILAILPLPQVVVPIIFSQMIRGSDMMYLNAAIVFQYVPRVLRIYLSWPTTNKLSVILWMRVAFSFFLYILASHVLGALWYFFSIQREIACWHGACENHIGCLQSSFNCDNSSGNHSFINDYCPVATPNTALFDFGIFLEVIQSGSVVSTNIPKKIIFCFWWGLRNLSSLGQNLQTSTYAWENYFAVLISFVGLILFLSYFIGNLQIYMQLETTKLEKSMQRSEEIITKVRVKGRGVELWILKNEFPLDMKEEIMSDVTHMLQGNKDFDEEKLLLHLSIPLRKKIKHHLCEPLLRNNVPLLKRNERLLQRICDFLKPVYYNERSYIVREGEPLDATLFITQGIVWSFTTGNSNGIDDSSRPECFGKRGFYGQDLLDWAFQIEPPTTLDLSKLPISKKTLKTHTKVEGFVLMANDLNTVVSNWTSVASALQAALWRCHGRQELKAIPAGLGEQKPAIVCSCFKTTSKSSSA